MDHIFTNIEHSKWVEKVYNEHLPDIGFFVEIGMGHTTSPRSRKLNFEVLEFYRSNTIELLNLGWSGIFIEPVAEFCYEASLLLKDKLDRAKIINVGASDEYELSTMFGKETMIPNNILSYKDFATKREYSYPGTKIFCKPTSAILSDVNCPYDIDLMSIDVEGYEDKALRGLDFDKHRPKMIIIESTRSETEDLIPDYYELIESDDLNSCYIIKGDEDEITMD